MQDLKVQIANQEDADTGVDLLGLNDHADGGAGGLPAAPGALGPAAGEAATTPVVATTSSSTTPPAAAAQPDPLATVAEPPVAWPVSVEPRQAAPPQDMEEDGTSERAGLGFQPPAQAGYSVDPHAAMVDAPAPSTPPARDQVPEPPRPSKRPTPQPMEEPTSKAPTLPGFTRATGSAPSSIPMPIRFTPVSDPANHVRFDMFPDAFPAIPGHLVGLLVSCTEKEMV